MKAVLCKAFGPPESLVMEEVPAPIPGVGEVLVDVHASALNFPDVLMIEGKYQFKPDFPFSPGGEYSGTIAGLGEGVSGWSVGDTVFAGTGHGGFVEQIAVASEQLMPIPKGMSFAQAAGIKTTYGTSYYALKQRANLQPGETLLVLGAAGGVGLAAVELGKAMGARVIAAASTDEKLQIASSAGADDLVNYVDSPLKDQIKALTDGKGADVIYDPVGGDLFDQCLRSINWNGRILVVGFASGTIPKAAMNLVLLKSCQIVGVFYGAFGGRNPKQFSQNFKEILTMFEDGKISPLVGQTFPFNEYAKALRCLSGRQAVGKVVVEIRS